MTKGPIAVSQDYLLMVLSRICKKQAREQYHMEQLLTLMEELFSF